METDVKKILGVIDMQNDFISGSLGSEQARSIVPKVVDLIGSCQWDYVIATMDTHDENYLNTLEGKMLPVKHCIKGTSGRALHKDVVEALNKHDNVYIGDKDTFGDLELPDLIEPCLHYRNKVELHICGLCTDVCVVSNALILRAFFPDSPIICHADCCAGVTQKKHEAALEVMRSCQINVEGV